MKRVSVLCLSAVLAAAQPGLAQPPAPPKAAPVDPATALAEARRLVAAGNGQGVFEPGADTGGATARHLKSGLICHFDIAAVGNDLMVFDAKGKDPGNDVGCTSHVREIVISIYANRVKDMGDIDRAQAGQIATIKGRYKDVKPWTGQTSSVGADGLPKVAVDRFEMTVQDQPVFTRAAAMRIGDWVFTERVTAPKALSLPADVLGGLMLANVARDVGIVR